MSPQGFLITVVASLAIVCSGCTAGGGDVRSGSGSPSVSSRPIPGSTAPGCFEVPADAGLARAGDFVAGNFADYRRRWEPGLPSGLGKIFWIPDRPRVSDTLTVTATPADGQPLTFTGLRLATADNGPLYPSSIPLPHKGIWHLEAAAGDNHGCFVLNL